MDNNERKLSDYIDKLNAEQKPKEHEGPTDSPELEKLYDTVRLARSLKEPAMPEADYPKRLACNVRSQLTRKNPAKNRRRIWLTGMAGVAAILVMAIMINFILPLGGTNIVYAMEEAFRDVKAYHGLLEIVQTNAEGDQTTQAKLEVWADKEGHYYIKGLEGSQKGLITVNNGREKWQIRPDQREVHIFPAFPDAYRFTFELGKEIDKVKNALSTKVVGEDTVAGRQSSIVEVSPQGGAPYRIWIDKETKLPLQKQYEMQNALQYTITYTEIEFSNVIPAELTAYNVPDGFKEINANPEQLVNNMEEAREAVGFVPKVPESIPAGYTQDSIAIVPGAKLVKLYYAADGKDAKTIVIQGESAGEFKPAAAAVLGKVDNSTAEIQSPMYEDLGILGSGGLYAGMTDISSIRWQQDGFEHAVVGSASLEELVLFTKGLANGSFEMPPLDEQPSKPQVEVPVDLEVEGNEQKGVDAGHSPWRLDPAFVAQVFVSLEMSPGGITSEYPIKYEDFKVTENNGKDAIVEASGDKTPIKRVYLKRLIRQDATGIWTVVGYDPTE